MSDASQVISLREFREDDHRPAGQPDPKPQGDRPHKVWHKRKDVRWGGGVLVVIAAILIFLALFNWDWLRGPLARYISAKTGREVHIDGHLIVHPFSWTPQATVGGLRISNPKWLGKGETFAAKAITVRVKLLPLFVGRTDVPLLRLDQPSFNLVRNAQGQMSWQFKKSDRPGKLPPIQNFIINDGKLHFSDTSRRLMINATIQSHENVAGGTGGAFQLVGLGSVNNQPFHMRVTGGALINVKRDQPYRFDADASAGATHITAAGAFIRPFDFGKIDARVTATGNDVADLYYLTGIALPNSPAYRLAGAVSRREKLYSINNLVGRVGDSDLSGVLSVDTSKKRPFLKANLLSRTLDMADMTAIFGGGKKAGGGGAQKVSNQTAPRGGSRLLPDARLDTTRIRAMDADVHYRAASIRAPGLPIRGLTVHLTLDDALLKADPLSFQLPQGQLTGTITMNARGATPVTDLDMRLNNARIEQFLTPVKGSIPMVGSILARAKLHGTGDSIYRATASSNGSITVVSPNGEIRKAFAELMGVNLLPGLVQLLQKNQERAQLRCAVGSFRVNNGVMQAQQITIDTDVVRVEGSGTISLIDESLRLRLQGKSKKFRILHLNAPIDVGGTLSQPKMHVQAGKAVAQAGVAAALGALVSPLTALLPFVDPGLAKNADCAGLMAQARQGPAAVAASGRMARR